MEIIYTWTLRFTTAVYSRMTSNPVNSLGGVKVQKNNVETRGTAARGAPRNCLSPFINPSLFHSGFETYMFHKPVCFPGGCSDTCIACDR